MALQPGCEPVRIVKWLCARLDESEAPVDRQEFGAKAENSDVHSVAPVPAKALFRSPHHLLAEA